jgi:DHA2 family multidrug resistance protein
MIKGSKVLITTAVMLAALMALLDISIVNVALSDIRASFGTPLDEIAWVSTGYMMANIVVIPMTGWFQRRFGFKRYFTASILLFTFASALCGLAWNLPSLVAFRMLQGMGGGAIIPTAQTILFSRYPKEEQGTAGALFGLGAVTGPLLGPTVGGYLIDSASWHWIFLINLPVGLAAAAISWRAIEEPELKIDRSSIDAFGIALLAVGMASLQYVLEEGNRDGWGDSPLIVTLGAVAAISLVTFVVHELETRNPIVDLRVFANRTYAASSGLNFLLGLSLFAANFLFSLYCGSVMHYSAFDIGILFLKGSAIQIAVMPLAGRLVRMVDSRILIAIGITGLTASLWLNAHLTQQADSYTMIMPLFVRACSMGLLFVPLNVVAVGDIPNERRGNALGLYNLTRELGGSIGTAWMSTALDGRTKTYSSYLGERITAFDPATAEQLAAAKHIMPTLEGAYGLLNARVAQQALLRAFNDGFFTLVFVFGASVALIAFIKKAKAGSAPIAAH